MNDCSEKEIRAIRYHMVMQMIEISVFKPLEVMQEFQEFVKDESASQYSIASIYSACNWDMSSFVLAIDKLCSSSVRLSSFVSLLKVMNSYNYNQ